MHPRHAFLFHRDYFFRPDASLTRSFVPQGLFLPSGCIPDSLFCSAGIIFPPGCILGMLFCSAGIISSAQMHLWHALLFRRDYFFCPNASLACSFVPQGLFLLPECISGLLFYSIGMHPHAEMHPCRKFPANQDAFPAEKTILDRLSLKIKASI